MLASKNLTTQILSLPPDEHKKGTDLGDSGTIVSQRDLSSSGPNLTDPPWDEEASAILWVISAADDSAADAWRIILPTCQGVHCRDLGVPAGLF